MVQQQSFSVTGVGPSALCPPAAARRRSLVAGAMVLLVLATGLLPAPAMAQLGRVQARPAEPEMAEQWKPGRSSRTACIDATRIAAAVVVDQKTVDVVMRGGKRWRLTLAGKCPQLSYYGGFYYKPGTAGQFCAGQDHIIGRAGGSCRVSRIAPLHKVEKRRR